MSRDLQAFRSQLPKEWGFGSQMLRGSKYICLRDFGRSSLQAANMADVCKSQMLYRELLDEDPRFLAAESSGGDPWATVEKLSSMLTPLSPKPRNVI